MSNSQYVDFPSEVQALVGKNIKPIMTIGEFVLIYENLNDINKLRFLNCLIGEDLKIVENLLKNIGIEIIEGINV